MKIDTFETKGNCFGADTEQFYDKLRWPDAAKYCHGCPVLMECRKAFVGDEYAYAGGKTPGARATWAAKVDAKVVIVPPSGKPSRREGGLTDEQKAEIVRIWESELVGPKVISEQVGCAKSSVQRFLRNMGMQRTEEERLELARRGGLSGGQKARGDLNAAIVQKYTEEGLSAKEIASKVGITLGHVYVLRRRELT